MVMKKQKSNAFTTPNIEGLLVLEQNKIEGSRRRMMQLILKTYYCMQEKLKKVEKNLKRYVSLENVLKELKRELKRIGKIINFLK